MTNIANATVRYQATREEIEAALEAIQAQWHREGIQTPVMDETGEIHPDAEAELLERSA
jgi:hypothetical protein